jgi:uncharacterized protein
MGKRAIIHIEIPAQDRAAAAEFYGSLFGWPSQHYDEMSYTTFSTSTVGGGFSNLDGEQVKAGDVLVHVESDEIEADLNRAVELGGSLIAPKMEIPGVGWIGIFADPSGNKIALLKLLEGAGQ